MASRGTLTFVPSVHFSRTHCRRVRETVRAEEPDIVAVELDERRFDRLEGTAQTGTGDLPRELTTGTRITYRTLKAIQRTVVRLYGLDPERTDMDSAIEVAAELDIDLALIDEPVAETMAGLSTCLGPETLPKVLVRMHQSGPIARANQVQLLTLPFKDIQHGDDVEPVVDHLRQLLPEVAEVLIDRRDRTMARRLHTLREAGHDVVAVIGAGHHNGILNNLADLDARDAIPDCRVPIRAPVRTVTRVPIS